MKFGVREICDVVFKAKANGNIGTMKYTVGQPVLFIDSAKTSTIEGAGTTVYATGGRGNSRLISWEGEKTLTFTVEDALLSPIGFAILSGAGLFEAANTSGDGKKKIYVHRTAEAIESVTPTGESGYNCKIDLKDALAKGEAISATSPVFVMTINRGSFSNVEGNFSLSTGAGIPTGTILERTLTGGATGIETKSHPVFVDFYIEKTGGALQLEIDAGNFAGYWYVEASTLFRRESDGQDIPAEIIFPNVKIQSNFTFTMASSGDPSTFTFTMDAMPGYTRFDLAKRVLCAIQIVDDQAEGNTEGIDSANLIADDEQEYGGNRVPTGTYPTYPFGS